MATSGTSSYNATRDQIIRRSLRQVGAFASGETPDNNAISDCAEALNAMIKEWDALGIHLWTEAEGILFFQANQNQYALGTGSTDHATQTNPPNFVQTTLSAAAAQGATSVSVASAANILNGDNIGIVLSSGALFWATVNGTPVGTTVTLAAGLTGAAASGNAVVDYTTAILRPLRIVAARRYNIASQIETPMVMMSRLDYRDLPNKTNSGIPTQFFYDPLGGATVAGQVYIWPQPNSVTDAMKFTWYRQIQDFNNPGDNPDLPQEWVNTLVWNLAEQIATEYDCPPARFQIISTMAAKSLDRVMGWDREPESVYFGVQFDMPFSR